jgi:hypothetical protein
MAGLKSSPAGVVVAALVGLCPQVLAFALAAVAVVKIETTTRLSGRSWAMTGMVSAVVCAVLILLLTGVVIQATG